MPFLDISDRSDLARELETTEKNLTYLIYKIPEDKRYKSFGVPKRNGDIREIAAPNKYLKGLQRKLADKLNEVYPGRPEVYGFAKGKNIYNGALIHTHKRWVVSLDLKDFFPSIHFGRVKGMFQAKPFCFDEVLSRELANICCYKQCLPQGAPTSPVISNLICWRLDNQLRSLARKNRCIYTRYADDITFSTNLEILPKSIGVIDENGWLTLSDELNGIIEDNRFAVNTKKVRYARYNNRQEVTGLIVNGRTPNVKRTYVRQVRAMLHACEKYGIEAAAEEHFKRYIPSKHPKDKSVSFMREVVGRAGYIRYIKRVVFDGTWTDSSVYKPIHRRIRALFPEAKMAPTRNFIADSDMPVLFGEGKTDWKIISRALTVLQARDEYTDIQLKFRKYDEMESVGYAHLLDICEKTCKYGYQTITLCVFDGDIKKDVLRRVASPGQNYRYWGGNVYSIVLPKPNSRNMSEISIEQYFNDREIKTPDQNGRRLYLSNEFNSSNGEYVKDPSIKFRGPLGVFNKPYDFVIEEKVFDAEGRSLAMSKNEFAENVLSGEGAFGRFSFDNFHLLFDVIREILRQCSKE